MGQVKMRLGSLVIGPIRVGLYVLESGCIGFGLG